MNSFSSPTHLISPAATDVTSNNFFDLQSLRRLTGSMSEQKDALKEAANQFEGIFVRQLLSSMRKVNDLFKSDSLFDSSDSDFYQEMWDDQIASSLSTGNSSSISAMLVQQLGGEKQQNFHPTQRALIGTEKNPSVIANQSTQKLNTDSIMVSENNNFKDVFKTEIKAQPIEKNIEPESFSTREEFLDYLLPYAKNAAQRLGASAKLLLAQAALETGWGKHFVEKSDSSSSKNLFNIKDKSDWQGEVAVKNSLEFDGDKFDLKKSSFRVYETFRESFEDFVDFLSIRDRYSAVIENVSDPKKYLEQLEISGYATDPGYAKKIEMIFNSDILQKIAD